MYILVHYVLHVDYMLYYIQSTEKHKLCGVTVTSLKERENTGLQKVN